MLRFSVLSCLSFAFFVFLKGGEKSQVFIKMKKLIQKLSLGFSQCLLMGVVYAQGEGEIELTPPIGWNRLADITLPEMISAIIRFALIAAAIIAFFFLVVGGIKWITSGGDKEGTANAQKTITAALVGLVIVFAAWAIMQLLETFFDIPILRQLRVPIIGE